MLQDITLFTVILMYGNSTDARQRLHHSGLINASSPTSDK